MAAGFFLSRMTGTYDTNKWVCGVWQYLLSCAATVFSHTEQSCSPRQQFVVAFVFPTVVSDVCEHTDIYIRGRVLVCVCGRINGHLQFNRPAEWWHIRNMMYECVVVAELCNLPVFIHSDLLFLCVCVCVYTIPACFIFIYFLSLFFNNCVCVCVLTQLPLTWTYKPPSDPVPWRVYRS